MKIDFVCSLDSILNFCLLLLDVNNFQDLVISYFFTVPALVSYLCISFHNAILLYQMFFLVRTCQLQGYQHHLFSLFRLQMSFYTSSDSFQTYISYFHLELQSFQKCPLFGRYLETVLILLVKSNIQIYMMFRQKVCFMQMLEIFCQISFCSHMRPYCCSIYLF